MPAPGGPTPHRLEFRISSHHGCSRSHATLALEGRAALTLRGGRAHLMIDYVSDHRIGAQGWQFGPRGLPGATGAPRKPIRVTRTRERRRFEWEGPVRRGAAGALVISLRERRQRCERLPAVGLAGGVAVRCWGSAPLTLTCYRAALQVHTRGTAAPAGRPAPSSLLLATALQCQAPRWPGLLGELLHGGSLYLSPGAPLRLAKHQQPGWLRTFDVRWER